MIVLISVMTSSVIWMSWKSFDVTESILMKIRTVLVTLNARSINSSPAKMQATILLFFFCLLTYSLIYAARESVLATLD